MKPKVFRDGLWPLMLLAVLFFASGGGVCLACAIPFWCEIFIKNSTFKLLEIAIAVLVFSSGAIGCFAGATYHLWFDRVFGRLLVYNDKIVFKCFLKRTRKITIEDCKYVGVEDYSLLNRAFPVVRGDEISFIYFSDKPYPQKYHGKITALKNKKGFIKFYYSDALAEALFELFPSEKNYLLRSFYGKMKANDAIAKTKTKKAKRKKK